jgi:hypothetical protein
MEKGKRDSLSRWERVRVRAFLHRHLTPET